ncbi:MAG: HlyD family secretion protein [Verrucomicrobia bacterium]|nr:HlyD family secretion protein [Verrucomicrobiota bacterium]
MSVQENTLPLNHVGARPPTGRPNQKEDANQKGKTRNGPPRRFLVIGAVIGVLAIFFGVRYWMYASTHEDTDDAYVTGNTHQISTRVTGTVQQVLVDDNWHVTAGQPLLKLDPRDYQVALTQARAGYLQAEAQLVQANAQIPLVEAQLAQVQAQADSSKANSDYLERTFERNSQLFYQGRGVISKQDLDNSQSQAQTNLASYKASEAAVTVAKENLKVAQAQQQAASAQVDAAQAQVQNAELQLSYCTIVAPVSGRIAQKTVQTGNRVSVGQALMAVVEDDVWILANLKETQLERVHVGQPVDIKIDALPHYRFKGRVDSLQPGSGSNFALLPPDNATGNFIKIVQRVPVKILFDPESIKDFRDKIVAGLSAQPSIAVTEKMIDQPYQDGPETEKPSHRITSQPITQIQGVPPAGVVQ